MHKGYAVLILSMLVAGPGVSRATDLTVDAVTRATELNPSVGDIAVLTDGITPDQDAQAAAFSWPVAGFLVVEWPHPVVLEKIRVYLGDIDRYAYYGYLGGAFNNTGQRSGGSTPVYNREGLGPGTEGWFDIPITATAPIDNMGIQFTGGATLYEIQFIGPEGTAVQPATLGLIKRRLTR